MNTEELLQQMLDAAKGPIGESWPGVRALATSAFKTLAQNMVDIGIMKAAGEISEEQARLLTDMQKNTLKTVLLTEKGLGLLAVEAAINAALGVVAGTVNKAIGWELL